MPRSSRHKSSKHSSRDAREYSDSEKEPSLKERKGKEESSARVSKESVSSDKRKLDSKDNKEYYDSVNGEYMEEYSSSKRRKEKIEDSVNDRWNGGDEDRGEGSKKSKTSSERSRRREEVEGEETKRSSSKSDGKHRESSRRESKEVDKEKDRDRDRKHKEGRNERHFDREVHNGSKGVTDKTDWNAQDQLQSPRSENYPEKRARRKRDNYGDGDMHQPSIDDGSDKFLASRDDNDKDRRHKEEKYKDEKHGDKNQEDIDKDNKHQGDKQRDDRTEKEHTNLRDDKDASESKRKKSGLQENDHGHGHEPDSEHDGYRDHPRDHEHSRDYEREHDRGRERDWDRVHERDRGRDHERERDHDRGDYERDRYPKRDRDSGRSRDRDWDHDRDRKHDRERDRSRDYYYNREQSKSERERDFDRDASHLDDQSSRFKESRERRRSPDDRDDLSDSKTRAITANRDLEARSSKAHPDGDRIRPQSRQPAGSHVEQEEFGYISDQRSRAMSSRDAADHSGGAERVSKYRLSEKATKMEDRRLGESSKASPRGLIERSSSSASHEPRHMNRGGTRWSLEIDETGQRSNARELSASEDRLSMDLPPEKPLGSESALAGESTFNNKANQNNPPLLPRPESRGGIGSPLVGSLEEENRVNFGGRYKRNGDPNMGRVQGNAWRGAPNRPSPVPNGFMPFQHGPPHGGFQPLMPQFPSPSLFGVRPSMEMSHPGIPYHMPDAERVSGHLHPFGWQNMMDGSGPSHMRGWDVGNNLFRDDPHVYGGAEWDHSRRMLGRVWEAGADAWKTQNGDASMDVSSMSFKDDHSAQAADDDVAGQTSQSESNRAKSVEAGSNLTSPAKELPVASPKTVVDDASDHPATPTVDIERYCRYYLTKLDVSVELADAELHKQCVNITDELSVEADKVTNLLVNLKSGGKAVPKRDYACLLTLSLFPNADSSVFQRAMEVYKEQRVEMKGVSTVKDENTDMEKEDGNRKKGDGSSAEAAVVETAMGEGEGHGDGDGGGGEGDGVVGEDASSGNETLVAESNESESVISWIHQSTH